VKSEDGERRHKPEKDLAEWNTPSRFLSDRKADEDEAHRLAMEVLKTPEFVASCEKAKVNPTKRQALKWLRQRGIAWRVAHP
jgi:hypothetical protein